METGPNNGWASNPSWFYEDPYYSSGVWGTYWVYGDNNRAPNPAVASFDVNAREVWVYYEFLIYDLYRKAWFSDYDWARAC